MNDRTLTSTNPDASENEAESAPYADYARYEVGEEVARGGLGRILRAYDERLGRQVAIKELISNTNGPLERFRQEAALTARLQHPAIVPIYDAGERINGAPFYVMKLLSDGRTLKELVAEARDLDARLALLPNVIAAVDAIAYAHSNDIIHRDLKPSNILVGPFGETVVIDWGLAKALSRAPSQEAANSGPYRESMPDMTAPGSVIGTPLYMAPEQARGEIVDKRADVYALGSLLYYMLAGTAPYDVAGASTHDVLRRVATEPAAPLESRESGIPKDLLAIVTKAMARDTAARYLDAQELADDLKRFQTGQLVRAHQYSRGTLVLRWLGRYRLPVGLSAAFAVLLGIVTAGAFTRIVRERNRADARATEMILLQAEAWLERDPTATIAWLKQYPPHGPDLPRLRSLALEARNAGVARYVIRRENRERPMVGFSHHGNKVVTVGPGSAIQVYDLGSGAVTARLLRTSMVANLLFSGDDREVFFSEYGSPYLLQWGLSSNTLTSHKLIDAGNILSLSLDRDETVIVPTSRDHEARFFNITTNELVTLGRSSMIAGTTLSPDGHWLTTSDDEGALSLWNLKSRSLENHRSIQTSPMTDLASAPDNRAIATSGRDGTIRLCDIPSLRCRVLGRHTGPASGIIFSADGSFLVSTGDDHTVRTWDRQTGQSRIFWGHNDRSFSPLVTRSDRSIVSAGYDATVRLWNPSTGDNSVLRGHRGLISFVALSLDDRWIASVSDDRTTRVWPLPSPMTRLIGRHQDQIQHLLYLNDGNLLSAGRDNTAHIWNPNARDMSPMRTLRGSEDALVFVAQSPDGDSICAAGYDSFIHLWNLRDHTYRKLSGHRGPVWRVAYSPQAPYFASAGSDGTIRIWSTRGSLITTLRGHTGPITKLLFSDDGKTLYSASDDHTVRAWSVDAGSGHIVVAHSERIYNLVLLNRKQRLISTSLNGVLMFDLTEKVMRPLSGYTGHVRVLISSRDERFLASGALDATVRLWDIERGTSRLLEGHHDQIRLLAFSGDGRLLATGSSDHTIRIWSTTDGTLLDVIPVTGYLMYMTFAPEKHELAIATDDGSIRLWRAPSLPAIPVDYPSIQEWLNKLTAASLDEIALRAHHPSDSKISAH